MKQTNALPKTNINESASTKDVPGNIDAFLELLARWTVEYMQRSGNKEELKIHEEKR